MGWDEGIPPLDIDVEERRVLGQVRFRLANEKGETPAEGEPVIEAAPGETVKLRVQILTEVPLNVFYFRVEWPRGHLRCLKYAADRVTVVFMDPEDGELYPPKKTDPSLQLPYECEKGWFLLPNHWAEFHLAGYSGHFVDKHSDRPLEYYKPLNEWRDVTEVQLRLDGCAIPGEEIPLIFRRYSSADGNSHPGPGFNPYRPIYVYTGTTANWTYDIDYQDGFIRVKAEPGLCPDPWPADPGVRFSLGRASGSPGQEVQIPIVASSEFQCGLRLALESDPPEVMVQGAEVTVKSLRTGALVPFPVRRNELAIFKECDVPGDESTCTYGIPGWVGFHAPEPHWAVIGLNPFPYQYDRRTRPRPTPGRSRWRSVGCSSGSPMTSRAPRSV